MPVTLNGRTWALSDFAPWGFRQNWMPFFEDLVAELSGFQGGTLRDQAAASAASAASSAARAQALVGSAGTGTATGLVYGAGLKSLVTAGDVVSVFVYDTRRDSDGGAWVEKCRSTSWYNEPLNTATRGATRRFPRVALIVARRVQLDIYDAHDLDADGKPRLWMRFVGARGAATDGEHRHVTACQGRIYLCAHLGVFVLNFTGDGVVWYAGYEGGFARWPHGLARRNETLFYGALDLQYQIGPPVQVSARVLPGAPLDRVGLPIPTVAVATSSGISVIHPWGGGVNITPSAATQVLLQPDGRLWVSSSAGIFAYGSVPYSDMSFGGWVQKRFDVAGTYPRHPANEARMGIVHTGGLIYASTAQDDKGLSVLSPDGGNPANGMVAYLTNQYATGWQPGDIRGAWLGDSATGSVAGSGELVTNGDFASGTTGWSAGSNGGAAAALSIVSGRLRVTNQATTDVGYAAQTISTVIGQTYVISADAAPGDGYPCDISVVDATGILLLDGVNVLAARDGAQSQFTATTATSAIRLRVITAKSGDYCDFDNVSVRVAMPDRSYKGRGLRVNGIVQRTGLPCGLSAITGFVAGNYLEQAYSADLDFGTGDFAVIWWAKSSIGDGYYLDRDSPTSGARWSLISNWSKLTFAVHDGGSGANVASLSDIVGDTWRLWCAVRRGGQLEIWCNGVREGTGNATGIGSLSNGAAKLRVGERVSGAPSPAAGLSAALLRITASAPTPAQIRRIYDDERALFQAGQPALLGGTSNNVAALASTPDTGSLLVGTGDGVSVISGLSRTAYYDGANTAGALGSDNVTSLSAAGPYLLVGTAANAGVITEARIGRDLMGGDAASASPPAPSAVTIDATPTDISPRLYVGEGETRAVRSLITARQYGASATQAAAYELRYLVRRDLGGSLALLGSVNVTVVHETAAGMDATVSVDATAQTVTERVTGLAATRLVWTVERQVLPLTMGEHYAA
ncbi:hypothetical protein GE253_19495 [Niveispirillum sp. SYP-B3756]|uniref:LamG-like jellyroll fold domain-containing protein n=1 Tax=Niveispirillum sp. SYP-B3756 TaxID=2662178 RepID=UPI0012914C40|nr:LamG-like jellyroll fold domain-containing protein [Niveispirillum sp. SYP-B3756]MQP67515.1 hypothetical protein [Niveispirillum sp. SYP-B3756]